MGETIPERVSKLEVRMDNLTDLIKEASQRRWELRLTLFAAVASLIVHLLK